MSNWNTDVSVSLPIKLHSARCGAISVFGNGFKAKLVGVNTSKSISFDGGAVFSSRTIRVNEKVGLRVTQLPPGATIALGFTTCNPDTITQEPGHSNFKRFSNTPGFWFMYPENASNTDSIVIQFYVNFYGDIRIKIDDDDTIGNGLCIPQKLLNNLWATIYFLCPSSIVEITHFKSTNSQPLPTLKYKNVQPLNLHPTRGKNVKMGQERGVAERIETEVCQGYVFSASPILPNQTVVIQILATESGYAGSLAFGVTSRDPSRIRPFELPDNAELLTERTRGNVEFWKVKHNTAENLKRGDVLTITRNFNGHIRLGTNNKFPVTCTVVEPKQTLWLFVDIYGATQKIKMYDINVPSANNLRDEAREPEVETRMNSMSISQQTYQSTNKHQFRRRQIDSQLPSTSSQQQRQRQQQQLGNQARPSQTTIAGETAGASTAQPCSNQDSPLKFNAIHGPNMEISHNRSRARTTCGIDGIAYSHRPIRVDEKVCFHILEKPVQCGVIIGFTSFGSSSPINSAKLDMSHCLMLSPTICKKDTIIRYWVNIAGQGVCNIGDDYLDLVKTTNVAEDNLYAVLCIGMGAVVEICDPNFSPEVITQGDDLPPISLRDTKGENIWQMNAAARDHYIVYEGFVFTANPMRLNKPLIVNILASEFQSLDLTFGFTTCDPTSRMRDLPTTILIIQRHPGTWVVDLDCISDLQLETGDKLAFKLALDGRVYVKKNGRVLHILRMHINHKVALWGFVNIRENGQPIISEVASEDIEPPEENQAEDNVTHRTGEESEQETAEGIDQRQNEPEISTESELILTPEEEAWIRESQPVVTEQWEEIPPEWLQEESGTNLNDVLQQSAPTASVFRDARRHRIPIISPEGIIDLQATARDPLGAYYYLTDITQSDPVAPRPIVTGVAAETTRFRTPRSPVIEVGSAITAVRRETTGFERPGATIGPRIADEGVGTTQAKPGITEEGIGTTEEEHESTSPEMSDEEPEAIGVGPEIKAVGVGTTEVEQGMTNEELEASEARPGTAEVFHQSIPVYDCVICFDAPINSAVSECGHMYMCYDCAVEQWKGRGDGLCPICRGKIEKVIRIYKP